MTPIKFSKEERDLLVAKIQRYFSKELTQEISGFDAEFLLTFFAEQIGGYYYNRGLYDAQALVNARFEDLADDLFQLEKPTELKRS